MVLLETRSNIGDSAVEVPIAGSLGGLLPGRWLPATAVASFDLERELPVELRPPPPPRLRCCARSNWHRFRLISLIDLGNLTADVPENGIATVL
jgi:hypothetical protein